MPKNPTGADYSVLKGVQGREYAKEHTWAELMKATGAVTEHALDLALNRNKINVVKGSYRVRQTGKKNVPKLGEWVDGVRPPKV